MKRKFKYIWYNLDNLEIINGESYCSMQLIERSVHTNIPGMTHSGAVAQYKGYYNSGYK